MATLEVVLDKMEKGNSIFEKEVRDLKTPACKLFIKAGKIAPVTFKPQAKAISTKDSAKVAKTFAQTVKASGNKILIGSKSTSAKAVTGKRIAVLFSGGPAAGGHNVVAGIFDVLGSKNTLLGVKAGPKGLLQGDLFKITAADVKRIKNTGGFDFLGSDRTKIKKEEQFKAVKKTCVDNKLDAIIVIGGDDSNTNAAVLAEYLFKNVKPDGSGVQVLGVPKTIDGDLQIGELLPISFGFDTATKIYGELVGNILQDTPSSRKYWHFVKLMGRSASHVTLEVALQTKPAFTVVSEEVTEQKMSLGQIVDNIAQVVVKRAKGGINHGVVLIPEGLIEFVPEMTSLITELNEKVAAFEKILDAKNIAEKKDFIYSKLTPENAKLMASLPDYIEEMLLAERDSHGNLQVSLIPTEKLLIDMVKTRVKELAPEVKFKTHNHFFGYEGRCGAPTLFDAAYTYNLGMIAGSLALAGKTGYMASFTDLDKGGKVLAIPLTGLLNVEVRHGKEEMVIEKALVRTDSPAFRFFEAHRKRWSSEDKFASPGPRQLWGPAAGQIPITIALNQGYKTLAFKV
ncbi:diphosphate--fructose-6-phosphate 1-phosphotransferase [Candidatus Margulisiibacteriota bacterium]